jgi:hypothetical protein
MESLCWVLQCIRDGKSIIVEGLHLDPGLYLSEFQQYRGPRSITPNPVPPLKPQMPSSDEGGATEEDLPGPQAEHRSAVQPQGPEEPGALR